MGAKPPEVKAPNANIGSHHSPSNFADNSKLSGNFNKHGKELWRTINNNSNDKVIRPVG